MKKFFENIVLIVFFGLFSVITSFANEDIQIGSGYYVPESISLEQFRSLDVIEKRIYGKSFYNMMKPKERVEQLEKDMYEEVQTGSLSQRISALRLDSTKRAISGTAMTPMMQSTFKTKYINAKEDVFPSEDVGLIDGLIKVWWPDFYAQINEYRKYKEAMY